MVENQIKAVIFDVGGVLALSKNPIVIGKRSNMHDLGVHEYISRKLRISIDQWFDAIDSIYADAFVGQLSERTTILTISRKLGVSPFKVFSLFLKAYKRNFKQNKKLYKLAFKLKKQGHKIAILSDQWWLSKEAVIKEKYMKKFNVVVISCDVGLRKPNPEIYKLTLKKLKLPAKNCLFIDNQTWNLTPAKKLGMKTILFKTDEQLFKQLFKMGVGHD